MIDVRGLLNTTVEVQRFTEVPDGHGGWNDTWATVATEVPARISQPTDLERQVAQQVQETLTHMVYLEPGADVRRGDQLVNAGRTLKVTNVIWPSVEIYRRAECQYVEATG